MTDSFSADPAIVSPSTEGGTFNDNQNPDKGLEFEVNGRKYDKDAAVVKISNADAHIAKLEAERKADRERLAAIEAERDKYKGTAEVLARKQQLEQENAPTSVDPAQIAREVANLVKGDLNEEARIATQRENLARVKQELTKKYGQNVDEIVGKVTGPLGMTVAEAMEMAKTKPKAFMSFFDKVPAPVSTATKPSVNSAGLKPAASEPPTRDLFKARTDKERVEIYQERLAQRLQSAS